jgi:mono/diheme cytochrome c family protein
MKRSTTWLALFLALPLMFLVSAAPLHAQKGEPDDGKDVYKKKCQSCHGPNGDKTTYKDVTFPALTAKETQAESDADLKKQSASGKTGKMGNVSGLSPQDLADVVAFIRSLAQ